jgi:hypothetical protein
MNYSLPSLNNLSPQEVEGVLANLTLGMLPNPGISEEPTLPVDLRDRLIREMRIALRLKRDDNSAPAMARIYDYLAKEISRAVLADVDVKQLKSRLGEKGQLAPSLYRIEFSPEFKDEHERKGVDRRDVELTLRKPDAVEHFHPSGYGIQDSKATSIYAKRFPNNSRPLNAFTLLVFCQRNGDIQRVGPAWMVFHSDVDLSSAETPSAVLKAFLERYGVDSQVGEQVARLFWYQRIPIVSEKPTNIIKVPHFQQGDDIAILFQQGLRLNDSIEVVYAFAVNNKAYDADLVAHGVRIKPSKRPGIPIPGLAR